MIESRIIEKNNFKVSEWSGGKTKELFISPENIDFGDRNFDYRISSATVENEESEFSKFEGYKRFITPLRGVMKLEHKDHHSILLEKYDIDVFYGDWETKSIGKCIDFNFIIKKDIDANMKIVDDDLKSSSKRIFIFSYEEDLNILLESENERYRIELLKENLLEITNKEKEELKIRFTDKNKSNSLILISLDK